jgi:hypothetical protein
VFSLEFLADLLEIDLESPSKSRFSHQMTQEQIEKAAACKV